MAPLYTSLRGSIGNLFCYLLILVFVVIDLYVSYIIKQNGSKPSTPDNQGLLQKIETLVLVSTMIKIFVLGFFVFRIFSNLVDLYMLLKAYASSMARSRRVGGAAFNIIFFIITSIVLVMDISGKQKVVFTDGFVHYWVLWVLPAVLAGKLVFTSYDIYTLTRPLPVVTPEAAWNTMQEQAKNNEPPIQGVLVEQPNETVNAATLNQRVPPPQPKTRFNSLINEAKQGGN